MDGITSIVTQLHEATLNGKLSEATVLTLAADPALVNECEVLDFKRQLPTTDAEYAKLIRDLVALHNSYGGFVVIGIAETEKDRGFELVGVEPNVLQINKIRDNVRAYCEVDIRVQVNSIIVSGNLLEAVWVAKRGQGERPVRFVRNGPDDKPGKPSFKKGDVVFRRIESNAIAQRAEDYDFLFSARNPPSLIVPKATASAGEIIENNLPDRSLICPKFVGRKNDIGELWAWLDDDFSRVRLIAGEGGLGKTSLAYRFSEELSVRQTKPFLKVVWLTAKKKQFIAAKDEFHEATHVDFDDAASLFRAIGTALGCNEGDFSSLDARASMQTAIESCSLISSFVVVDDIDSLSQDDQLRALEFGMRAPPGTKLLLTTRVNFSYSPDNVLKLDGLESAEFKDYVVVLRDRYRLPAINDSKIEHLRDVTGGSPLYTDSLIRLERRGMSLDKAMVQWKGERGLEVRKAALSREVQQLSREAKRVLFVISTLRNCSYTELAQIVDYTDQTLGDALQELSGLFLISAPSIAKEARYTVEPNTGLLVIELAATLGIDHAALVAATKRSKSDAIGLGLQKRSGIVGLAISEAMAQLKAGNSKGALEVVTAASKKLSRPHPDLLLAAGRFNMNLPNPNLEEASKAFNEAFKLGQRKPLLFELWFEAESGRGRFDDSLEVASQALGLELDRPRWYERRAQIRVALAQRARSRFSNDAAVREIEAALSDLTAAKNSSSGEIQEKRFEQLVRQAKTLRSQLIHN
ncbi:ATP-binding protein [Caballeronia sp. ATUFL_F1_KS39]|uniref:ATP-binding protein n=1 Tax=Caballeronia sp. ATUFL_F1_KS39 TaxID=2921766 RepID=UPI002027A27C|nr:ATP-binding protein [Caballeronia sp. ATUFL_F1_KS39]